MGWKGFIKPDWRRLILFFMTMGGLNYFWISMNDILDARELFGLPLGFYPKGSFMMWPGHSTPPTVEFSWVNFMVDILFWYLIACIIFYVYDKIKEEKKSLH